MQLMNECWWREKKAVSHWHAHVFKCWNDMLYMLIILKLNHICWRWVQCRCFEYTIVQVQLKTLSLGYHVTYYIFNNRFSKKQADIQETAIYHRGACFQKWLPWCLRQDRRALHKSGKWLDYLNNAAAFNFIQNDGLRGKQNEERKLIK